MTFGYGIDAIQPARKVEGVPERQRSCAEQRLKTKSSADP